LFTEVCLLNYCCCRVAGGKRQNLIAQAKTGSGKTGCFVISALSLVDTKEAVPQVIVLAPTRPLVLQIYEEFLSLAGVPKADFPTCKQNGIASVDFKSGMLSMRLLAADWKIEKGQTCTSQIVVGTPDRIKNLLNNGQLDGKSIKLLILDEADEMVKEGNSTAAAEKIMDRLLQLQGTCIYCMHQFFFVAECVTCPCQGGREAKGNGGKGKGGKGKSGKDRGSSGSGDIKFQMLLFSATFDQQTWKFSTTMTSFAPCAHIRQKQSSEGNVASIRKVHFKIDPSREVEKADLEWGAQNEAADPVKLRKMSVLDEMYAYLDVSKSIIFCNTRRDVNVLVAYLRHKDHACSVYHGDMDNALRDKTMEEFRVGTSKVLVTTDVNARGVDIPDVTLVVIFDIPMERGYFPLLHFTRCKSLFIWLCFKHPQIICIDILIPHLLYRTVPLNLISSSIA
jgi:superfamily II DNA/RNA helicase